MAVLVKGKMILTSGFVRVSNGAIIPAALVKLLSDAAEPVLVDQVEMAKAIGTAITSARVELLTTDNIDNMETNYDAFIKANKQNQHDQYSTIDIKYIGTDELYLNPPVVESYLFDGQDYIKLTQSIELRDLADTLLNELVFKANSDDVLLLDGSQQMETGYIPQKGLDVEVVESVTAKLATLKAEINGVESTRDQTQQDEILDLYEDERADYVKVQDIAGSVEINADITPVVNGNDVTIDVSGLDLNGIKNDLLVVFKLKANNGQDDTIYIRDSYNNGTGTPNRILDQDGSVVSTAQLITISGLNNIARNTIAQDYKLTLISQVAGAAGAGIDQIARSQIATETAARIAADGKLQSKLIANAIDGLTSVEAILKANNDLIKTNYKELSEDGKIKNATGTREIIVPEKKGTLTIESDVFLKTDYEEKKITIPTITETRTKTWSFNSISSGSTNHNITLSGWTPKRLVNVEQPGSNGEYFLGPVVVNETEIDTYFGTTKESTYKLEQDINNVNTWYVKETHIAGGHNFKVTMVIEYEKVIPAQTNTMLVKK